MLWLESHLWRLLVALNVEEGQSRHTSVKAYTSRLGIEPASRKACSTFCSGCGMVAQYVGKTFLRVRAHCGVRAIKKQESHDIVEYLQQQNPHSKPSWKVNTFWNHPSTKPTKPELRTKETTNTVFTVFHRFSLAEATQPSVLRHLVAAQPELRGTKVGGEDAPLVFLLAPDSEHLGEAKMAGSYR